MNKKTFNIYTLGCKANQYDSEILRAALRRMGFRGTFKNANFSIINTCSVTKSAISKCKKTIIRARKESPDSKVVLIGCWPRIYRKEADSLGVDMIFEERDYDSVATGLAGGRGGFSCISGGKDFFSSTERTRYFIKIQDGCEQYCSYCIIPYARGKMKSRCEDDILREVERAGSEGFEEVVLSGIHIGLFGREKGNEESTNLYSLVKKISKFDAIKRVRISSIEVTEIDDRLIEMLKRGSKLCSHFHISLQSGSNKILKRMNRPYTTSLFRKKIEKIREMRLDIAITTDVIVGFPGETEQDFNDTYDFCKEMNFSKIHVFSFSAHEKTPAFKMGGRVDSHEIVKRSKRLRELSDLMEKIYKDKFIGKKLSVVLSKRTKGGALEGKTEYSFDINFSKKELFNEDREAGPGEIVSVKWNG